MAIKTADVTATAIAATTAAKSAKVTATAAATDKSYSKAQRSTPVATHCSSLTGYADFNCSRSAAGSTLDRICPGSKFAGA